MQGMLRGGAAFGALCVAMDYVMDEYLGDMMSGM